MKIIIVFLSLYISTSYSFSLLEKLKLDNYLPKTCICSPEHMNLISIHGFQERKADIQWCGKNFSLSSKDLLSSECQVYQIGTEDVLIKTSSQEWSLSISQESLRS